MGNFLTASSSARDIRFLWSADTVGQGYGINPDLGGMRIYETMRQMQPNFFLHSGDTIYADNPVSSELTLADGSKWRKQRCHRHNLDVYVHIESSAVDFG